MKELSIKFVLSIAIVLLVPISVLALQPPHDASNNIGCGSCHAMHKSGGMMGGAIIPRGAEQESLCKTCHNPTGQAPTMDKVANHTVNGGAEVVDCGSCHDAHSPDTPTDPHTGQTSTNLKLIRSNTTKYIPNALEPAIFQVSPDDFAFDQDSAPWDGICQTCHTQTGHHTNNAVADHIHEIHSPLLACTSCHLHEEGFQPGNCTTCHNQEQGSIPRRQIVENAGDGGGDFKKASHHIFTTIENSDCRVCHDISEHKSQMVKLKDPDGSNSVYYSPADPGGLENFCINCHDADGAVAGNGTIPFSDGRTVPNMKGQAGSQWVNSAHKQIGYAPNGNNPLTCFGDGATTGCHGNGHGSDTIKILNAGTGTQIDTFCYSCHTNGMITNNALSGTVNDIEEAFGMSEKHDLGTSFTIGSNSYNLQCTTCHNPHVVTGKYWEAENGVSPVTRPDLTANSAENPRAMGTALWGTVAGEKMDDFAAQASGSGGFYYKTAQGYQLGATGLPSDRPAVYQPPKSGSGYNFEFSGDILPDYTTLCLDCHSYRMSDANPPVNWGQGIGCTDNSVDPPDQRIECGAQHGLNMAGKPYYVSDSGTAGNWGSSGNPDVIFHMNYVTRGRHNGHFMRWPYDSAERSAGINYVMSCTDCHEAHGSSAASMLRSTVNAYGPGTSNWNTMCNNCHYYYGGQHAGKSCGNASCHEANSIHRIIHTTDSGAGTQLMLTTSGYESDFQRPDFTPEIDSIKGDVGGNELLVTFRSSQYGAGQAGIYTEMDLTGALQKDDFWLFDINDNKSITSVSHTAGETGAIITLTENLTANDKDNLFLATTGKSIWGWYEGGYENYATGTISAQAVPAGPWQATINLSIPETGFQLNESAGSTTATDDSGLMVATVGNPNAAFIGDGYFHGDGQDNSTYVYYENTEAYFDEGKTFTYEVRFKPSVIDLDSEENNPGNTLDRTVQVLFERKWTYNLKISRADFWGDNNPPPGKAFVYIWYHPNNNTEGGRKWHQAFSDGAGCYIEADHWYKLRLVFNSDKVGGIPVDFFIDDQGTDGMDTEEAWPGYINCTRPPSQTDTYRSTEGNEVEPVSGKTSYPFCIGAYATNKDYTLNGLMDWLTYKSTPDYSGVDSPAPVEAVAHNGHVEISWGAVAGVTSYNIYWDTSSGVTPATGTQIPGVNSPYTQSGTNGTTYYYIVTAMKDVNGDLVEEEIASSEVKAMPVNAAPSSLPTNVVAEGFNKAVMLTWDAAPFATSYNIYWDTSSSVTTATGNKITGATSPFVHLSRTNGTTYYYIITSVNSFGEFPIASGEVSGTANQHPTVTAVAGDRQVELSWADVTGATSYNIYWESDPEVTRATANKIEDVISPYIHSSLTNGTTYYYIVTAVHPTGETFGPYAVSATPTSP